MPTSYAGTKNWECRHRGTQLNVRICPLCGDSHWHFYMNKESGQWDCKKCQESGSLFQLKKTLGDIEELTFRTQLPGSGVFFMAPSRRCSSRSGLRGKHGEREPEGFEPFALNGIQRPVEPPLGADPDDGGVFELAGDHQSRRTGCRFVVPTG